jgi:phosphohistidine swiveling domain-containing protein
MPLTQTFADSSGGSPPGSIRTKVTTSTTNSAMLPALGSIDFSAEAGGRKAAPLHELMLAGVPVPSGFVVPPHVELDTITERQLESAVVQAGGYPLAARSSGHLEDLPGASFAGQYVTRLGVRDVGGLMRAIAECRASAGSAQVVAYLRRNGLDESQARVSVLVQTLIDAAVAGVAFSIDPMTGREEHSLIECCHGLGEKLVSGQTNPTRYLLRLEDATVVERQPGGENVKVHDEVLRALGTYVLELQAHFGMPQDIEWALDKSGKLWILQSRPITRIHWRSDIEEFTSADFREGGVSARVCTPLMYSLYRDAVQSSMQRYFVGIKLLPRGAPQQNWIGIFYGRPYWSASAVKKALLKVPGFDEEVFDRDLGIQKDYGRSGPARTPMTLRTLLPAIPVAIALERNYRRHLSETEAYGRRFMSEESGHLKAAASFAETADEQFFALLRNVLNFHLRTESDYFTTIYNNANFQSDLKKLLKRIEIATGGPVSAVALMSGLQDISHMKMQRGLVRLVKIAKREGTESSIWERALADFLAENYYHGDVELDISTPRWGERPTRVKTIVEDILRSGTDPRDPEHAAQDQFGRFSAEEQRILAALRRKAWHRAKFERPFRKRLRLARTYLSRREEMREYSTRAYNVVRRYVLEAGARLCRLGYLKDVEDAFMLHTPELVAIGNPGGDRAHVLGLAHFRRLMYLGYRLLEPPGELGRDVTQQSAPDRPRISSDSVDSVVLNGIGCSAGIITALVRVVPGLEQADSLKPGEILVTRFTDPGWTPILGLVAGVVTEVGGLLSHAAVIGREYGIPAVLNVAGATQILKTGQRVELDGSQGTVKLLRSENPEDHD